MDETLKHIYDLLESQHFTCHDFHHNKQDQHKPGEICKPLKNFEKVLESLRQIIEQPKQDPVAMRYDFDGYGWKYIDAGSGSDWQTRIKDAEPLYISPQPRKWVGLTEKDRLYLGDLSAQPGWDNHIGASQTEELLRRKNNGC